MVTFFKKSQVKEAQDLRDTNVNLPKSDTSMSVEEALGLLDDKLVNAESEKIHKNEDDKKDKMIAKMKQEMADMKKENEEMKKNMKDMSDKKANMDSDEPKKAKLEEPKTSNMEDEEEDKKENEDSEKDDKKENEDSEEDDKKYKKENSFRDQKRKALLKLESKNEVELFDLVDSFELGKKLC